MHNPSRFRVAPSRYPAGLAHGGFPSQSECQNLPNSRAAAAGFHNHWPIGDSAELGCVGGEAWVWISHGSVGWIRIHRMALARFTCANVEIARPAGAVPMPSALRRRSPGPWLSTRSRPCLLRSAAHDAVEAGIGYHRPGLL